MTDAEKQLRDELRDAWDALPCVITDACEPDHAGDLVHAIKVLAEEWQAEKDRADANFESCERVKGKYSKIAKELADAWRALPNVITNGCEMAHEGDLLEGVKSFCQRWRRLRQRE